MFVDIHLYHLFEISSLAVMDRDIYARYYTMVY